MGSGCWCPGCLRGCGGAGAWAGLAFWAGSTAHREVHQLIRIHKVLFTEILVSLFVIFFPSITGQ